MQTDKPKERIRVNLTLPIETHAKLKAACARRRVTIQWAIEKMLDKAVAQEVK
jgi:hypothetical protein